ncbi:von Willebrand factor type A domain protein [Phycisphaerae bacterium RAS1]|nr:von Willebrand factor type A domain protein [Phycisphaerae bacterium RAS1]
MKRYRMAARRRTRRGGVVVQVAVMSTVIFGMGALAVDVGTLYTAKAEMQAAVDSAALAAAARLAGDGVNSPTELARTVADEFARMNRVAGHYTGLDMNSDVEFGQATYDAGTNRFGFSPSSENFNAVRIRMRRTEGSEGGPLPMMFGNIFGVSQKDMWARATAVLIPRDISVVIDLSGSMNDDSELQHYKQYTGDTGEVRPGMQINLRDCWAALNGPAPARPYVPGAEADTEYAGDSGPTIGVMSTWGSPIVPESYTPSTDAGLWYIPKKANCTVAAATTSLQSRGCTADEISRLMNAASYDNGYSNNWRNRAAVIVGLASWRSGRPGGTSGGDGDNYVEDSEMVWTSYPSWRHTWTWANFIDYTASTSSAAYYTNNSVRYRVGLKTFTNFLLEQQAAYSRTDVLWQTPEQPLQAVKDAVQAMKDVIAGLESMDHIGLEIFATTARHEVDLTDVLQNVPDRLYGRQAGHYDSTTNIGGGIVAGRAELLSSRGRSAARKIMVLMSDGKPNIDENGGFVSGGSDTINNWCIEEAQVCADNHITIYTVSVGGDADVDLMATIATTTGGQHFHAEGTPEEYADQLQLIFRTLGGRRPVALIE